MHVPTRVIRPLTQGKGSTEWLASSPLHTKNGVFQTHVFRAVEADASSASGETAEKEHVALVFGDIAGKRDVPIRVHSECMTSEVFGSLKCDCKEQLDAAMAEIARRGAGAVLYLRQEGRGIGLANKIRAYALQAHGADTVDANRMLGLPDDARRYDVVKDMLDYFDVKSVRLMTNNPAKVEGLRALGVDVESRIPSIVKMSPIAARYVETKRVRMAHDVPELKLTGSDAE
ncbi:GTP cyclohydrolase II [soil metagenome]